MNLPHLSYLTGGGDMGERLRTFDWAAGPLGHPVRWPQPLKTLVAVLLAAEQPMFIAWGAERTLLYNDSYAPMLGRKHGTALGRPFFEVWPEVRDELIPMFDRVFAGEPVHMDDISLMLNRHDGLEEAHFAFSYTPVRDEQGAVVGLFCPCTETTEVVFAKEQARLQRERLAQMFEQGPGLMAMLRGPRHELEFANPAYLSLIGDRDVLGRAVAEALPEAAEQGYVKLLDEVYQSGQAYSAVGAKYVVPDPRGGERARFVDFVFQPLIDASGRVTGILLEGVDVTERTLAESALRESETYTRLLLDSISEAVYAIDRCGVTTVCNPAFVAMLGFADEAEVLGRKLHDVIHHTRPDGSGYPVADCPIYRCARDGTPAHVGDELFFRQDGSSVPVEYWVHPIVRDGELQGAICNFLDITERRRNEQVLRELNETLEQRVQDRTRERDRVWRNSRDLLAILDATGIFRAVNPAWAAILGHQTHEVVGRRFLEFVRPEDAPTERGLTDFENACRHKDGGFRLISWRISVEGDLVYAYGRDITAEREAAAALAAVQEQLRQAQKMEAVGQLTGGLAHDFNNLLTGVIGSLEMLQTRVAQGRLDTVDRYVESAQGAARRAAALTQRLLAFSRRQTLDPKPTDVNRLIAGMEELVRRTVGPAIDVEVIGADGLWTTLVDPNQLENALLNLCINARDAMPGGGRLSIESANAWLDARGGAERDLAPGEYLSLCVTDSGAGMTPEVMARAFDPFFTTKPIGEGTGLGLSMIYGFVRQSGGQVHIRSELAVGTTVCIHLPRHLGPADAVRAVQARIPLSDANHGETVLVVDDEPTVRMLVTEVLADAGYTAIEAADGPAGLKILQSDVRIDLLITDVGLPGGLNGRQVADAGRRVRPGLKVLFITGYAENAAVGADCLEPGMQVLTKPFAMDTLGEKLREMVRA